MLRTIRDYRALKRFTPDVGVLVRHRRRHRSGETIRARLAGGKVELRGGTQDVSVFFEIFARDVYRLGSIPGRLGTVIDLGANVGLFALRVAPMSGRVLGFEPMPENFERLRAHTAGLANVSVHPQAVGSADGTLALYPAAAARGTGRFSAQPQAQVHDPSRRIEVECIGLDSLFDRHRIERCDLLKIDIEGSEYDVLLNASAATLAKIQRIHGEFHPSNDRRDALAQLKARLDESGFVTTWAPQRADPRYGMFFAHRA